MNPVGLDSCHFCDLIKEANRIGLCEGSNVRLDEKHAFQNLRKLVLLLSSIATL